jgi:hypothetical protein
VSEQPKLKEFSMANMQERLDSAVNQAETDTGLLHTVVHGSNTTEVETEGGKVPSVAKVLSDMQALLEADEAILYLIANGDTTTVVHTKNGDVSSAAKLIYDAETALNKEVQILHEVANGDSQTVVKTENGEIPSVAKAIEDTRSSIQSGTSDLVELAQTAAETAGEQATQSSASALRAIEAASSSEQAANEAQLWVSGTDEEVAALGGKHSARQWVELAAETTKGSFPTTVSGVAAADQTVLPLPEALSSQEQILSVTVENISLMPDTYTLANEGTEVVLSYPLTVNERWCVKYLTDFQSLNTVLDSVLYEDM